jgi:hypothetical protein
VKLLHRSKLSVRSDVFSGASKIPLFSWPNPFVQSFSREQCTSAMWGLGPEHLVVIKELPPRCQQPAFGCLVQIQRSPGKKEKFGTDLIALSGISSTFIILCMFTLEILRLTTHVQRYGNSCMWSVISSDNVLTMCPDPHNPGTKWFKG